MNNQLQINKENAVAAYKAGDASSKQLLETLFGKEVFQNAKISSFDEALKLSGKTNFKTIGIPDDEIAFAKLKIIIQQLNGDWEADWSDKDQPKYIIWWNMNSFSLCYLDGDYGNSSVPSRLCFRDSKTADYFLSIHEFVDLYKTYMLG